MAAPVIITFAEPVEDKAAAQATFKLTTDKGDIQGSWGWLQDEDIQGTGVKQSIVHFRPAEYWPAYTNVHVEANLTGVNYGGGKWGKEDIVTDFTIGRDQRVQADVNSFHMVVMVDGKIVKNYPVSYGKESVPGRATVSGIHVVTEKFPTFSMCNPEFDYCNVEEKFAVRINNNGEFIHENALTTPYLGKENVSHGCINMGVGDAEDYYNSAIYGDPVEVTNTGVPMTEKDAIYDWIYSFADWQKLSRPVAGGQRGVPAQRVTPDPQVALLRSWIRTSGTGTHRWAPRPADTRRLGRRHPPAGRHLAAHLAAGAARHR